MAVSMDGKTRIAVIGAGYWGSKLSREYTALQKARKDFELAYVVDVSKERLDSISKDLDKKTKLETDYKKVLSDKSVSAVHIALPNELHYRIGRDALESGKNVLIEKPMALTSSDAYKLSRLAEEKGLVLQVGHIFRFNNALRVVRQLISEGAIGKVFYANVSWAAYYEKPPSMSNIVFDLAPHPIDILNFLLDEWPMTIDAIGHSYKFPGQKAEDMAFINLGFPDNVIANVYVSWIHHSTKDRSLKIVGEKGSISCDTLSQEVHLYDGRGDIKIRLKDKEAATLIDKDGKVIRNNTMQDIQSHFIDAVQKRSPQFNSAMVGAATVQVLERINRAMEDWTARGSNGNNAARGAYQKNAFSIIKDVQIGDGTVVRDHVNLYKCTIGRNCKIESFVYIEEGVTIGDNCKIKPNVYIPSGVEIGSNVFIGPSVTFTNDKYPKASGEWKLLKTTIGDGASIGAHSVILPGIRIGKGSMVGAGSVVTKDVPDKTVVYGNPARPIDKH
ncbi:MAG: Gfo/Idh/MocA family oxidoreductase, partial [Candidatus Micrarchaeota archaeon]|nr:Gfo/Idh/MocA family oxidoreductase [Candidatus Micrarchaeota archaeon]